MSRAVMQQALAWFEDVDGNTDEGVQAPELISALKEALAQPPLTRPANSQDWAGMDGATAFHLIERHSDNWSDASMMMDEWRLANPAAQPEQWTHEDTAHRPGGLAQPDATLIREGTIPDHIAGAGKKVDHFADAGKPMQPEQEPVAKVVSSGEYDFPMLQWLSANHSLDTAIGSLLYASPPQRQPLTDAEIDEIVYAHTTDDEGYDIWCNGQGVARAIEAAHNIKAAP